MQFEPIQAPSVRQRSIRNDVIVAVVLATVLSVCWAIKDWPRLGRLLLVDPDDTMRLLQVRDWLAGQGINDWTQYRMAPPFGSPMHWSRVNDFGIAAIILAVTPFAGRHYAELTAVLLYPALLFAGALFLSARIGRALWGPPAAPIAAVLTAIAFPGTTVFVPGRIDHHALQVVLIQLLVLLLMRAPTLRIGLVTGALAAISLVVGLESAPQVAAIIMLVCVGWVAGLDEARERLVGFAAALAGVTLLFVIFLRPTLWSNGFCDAFTPASATAAIASAVALGALAALHPFLPDWRGRLGVGALLGTAALAGTLLAFPACISGPYGAVDPFLLKYFYPHIVEANGIFAQDGVAAMLAVSGVVLAACVVSIWLIAREPRRWPTTAPVVATLAVSAIVMLVQVRGGYIGAPLAAPVLAGLILAARRRARLKTIAVVGAWLASAGLTYLQIPATIESLFVDKSRSDSSKVQLACIVGDTWREVDRYPSGVVMAGTNVAAFLIGATRHSTIGAGYHRANRGNMAVYRFYLGDPRRSRAIAKEWNAKYMVFCPTDFREVEPRRNFPNSLAAALHAGRHPAWLVRLPLPGTPLQLYRIR